MSLGAGAPSKSVLSEESSLVSRCLSLILGSGLPTMYYSVYFCTTLYHYVQL